LHHHLSYVTKAGCHVAPSAGCSGAGSRDKLIDIGCGDGRFCVAAAQHAGVARAVGIEHDPRLVERCRERAAACGLSAEAAHFFEVIELGL
jgi:tRNA G46 methylase TrmB